MSSNSSRLGKHAPLLSGVLLDQGTDDPLRDLRPALVPLGRLLVGVRDLEHGRVASRRTTNLQSNRQAGGSETARDGNRRPAVHVERGSILNIAGYEIRRSVSWSLDHVGPAPFPVELAERLIQMFSFAGDTVLDPFVGTGSTSVAAVNCGRNSIGNEIDDEYLRMTKDRLAAVCSASLSP